MNIKDKLLKLSEDPLDKELDVFIESLAEEMNPIPEWILNSNDPYDVSNYNKILNSREEYKYIFKLGYNYHKFFKTEIKSLNLSDKEKILSKYPDAEVDQTQKHGYPKRLYEGAINPTDYWIYRMVNGIYTQMSDICNSPEEAWANAVFHINRNALHQLD